MGQFLLIYFAHCRKKSTFYIQDNWLISQKYNSLLRVGVEHQDPTETIDDYSPLLHLDCSTLGNFQQPTPRCRDI